MPYINGVTVCSKCSTPLVAYDNWSAANVRGPTHICRSCTAARSRERSRKLKAERDAYCLEHADEIAADKAQRREAWKIRQKAHLYRSNLPQGFDPQKVEQLYRTAAQLTKLTGQPYHVDHVIPRARGGLHHQDNLVVMLGAMNLAKSDAILPWMSWFFE
ncbi:HNH endonuclease [Brevundimonas diminuta]|uniref:HNH endonuclease n=1 Tax=Brevundimonas diminuta TaxID=293 RepID=UPI0025A5B040|nr:HNH endonuclease signature motif containing protein [Brevundimonas diminuta]MDM8353990.1 HNH endonuclease signature motif containing protein [Brevundimonas diminuta]